MGHQLANTSTIAYAEIVQATDALRWYLIEWCKQAEAMGREGAIVDSGCIECAQSSLRWMQYLMNNWPSVPVDTRSQHQLRRDKGLQQILSKSA